MTATINLNGTNHKAASLNVSPSEILDLGCGEDKITGAVGMDRFPSPGVDVVQDLNTFPWPFKDNTFSLVRMSQIIEHLTDLIRTMQEIHRVCKPGAKVYIYTPHFSSANSFTDPTHCQHLAYHSMDYFTDAARYAYTEVRYRLVDRKITFGKSVMCWPGRLISALSPDKYEKHFCFLFPARDVEFVLEVEKS